MSFYLYRPALILGFGFLCLIGQPPLAIGDDAKVVRVVISVPPEVLEKLSPDQKETLHAVQAQAENDIRLIQDIKFAPPQSVFNHEAQIISIKDLFISPNDGKELSALAVDANGAKKELSPEQWTQLREQGLFVVPSEQYPGQYHVWKITSILQKGSKNIKLTLEKSNASAIGQFTVEIPARFVGSKHSYGPDVVSGFRQFLYGLRQSISQIVGLPETKRLYSESEVFALLEKERAVYLAATTTSEAKVANDRMDLRLYDDELMAKALPLLSKLENKNVRRFAKIQDQVSSRYRQAFAATGLTGDELEQNVANSTALESQEGYYALIEASPDLEALSSGLGKLLVRNGRTIEIIMTGETALQNEIKAKTAEVLLRVQNDHPTKSKVPAWLDETVEGEVSAYYNQIRDQRYQEIVSKVQKAGFTLEALILAKNIEFITQHQTRIADDLRAKQVAAREYVYSRKIYRPSKYVITQDKNGRYSAETNLKTTVASDSPAWRLQNLWYGSVSMGKNAIYNIMYENLWDGPVGLRALGEKAPFHPGFAVNSETGAIEEGRSTTNTLRSRWSALKDENARDRAEFEAKPDNSLFGKSFSRGLLATRQFAKLYVGGGLAAGLQTGATVANTAVSVTATAASVAWLPLTNLALMGLNTLVYDSQNPTASTKYGSRSSLFPLEAYLVVRTGFLGVGQMAAGLVAGTVYHPVIGTGQFIAGEIQAKVRTGADDFARWGFMENGLLHNAGFGKIHIPARDEKYIVKRIKGPGLATDYFYQVSPELAALAMWAKMESNTFNAYEQAIKGQILSPQEQYRNFVAIFGEAIGLREVAEQIEKSRDVNLKARDKALESYRELYAALTKIPEYSKIKMTFEDLEKTIQLGAALSEKYYTEEMKDWSPDQVDAFWKSNGVDHGDFVGLSKTLLSSSFSPRILEPIEETDKSLRLHVDEASVGEYVTDVMTGELLRPLEDYKVGLPPVKKESAIKPTVPLATSAQVCRNYLTRLLSF